MAVELRCDTPLGKPYASGLKSAARELLRLADLARCELSLMLLDDRAIRALNRDFRAQDQPTDVLSFSQMEDRVAPPASIRAAVAPDAKRARAALGDVVISVETACRQAHEMRTEPARRLVALLIHGFLHLLGYDHERSPAQARQMFALERDLAVQVGHLMRTSAASARPRPAVK